MIKKRYKFLIVTLLVVFVLSYSNVCCASHYREVNTWMQSTGTTPAIHATLGAVSTSYLMHKGFSTSVSMAIPWILGLIKELTDKNFGWDDLAANTIGVSIGAGVTILIRKKYIGASINF